MAFAAAGAEYCDGAVGDGTSDQFQYYLHHRYDTKDNGNSGLWSAGVLWGTGDSHVPVYQTLYEKVVEKTSGKIWLSG